MIDRATPSNQSTVRRLNRRQVLQRVIDGNDSSSRASIARDTGLTSATISSIVAELIDDQLVENCGLGDSTGGKPPTSLRMRVDRLGIGSVVVRRHLIRMAVVDLRGNMIVECPPIKQEAVVTPQDIRQAVATLVAQSPVRLVSIGIDTPGALSGGVVV